MMTEITQFEWVFLGAVFLIFYMAGFFVFAYKLFTYFMNRVIKSDKDIIDGKIKLAENMIQLNETINMGYKGLESRLSVVLRELDELATKDIIRKNQTEIIGKLEIIKTEVSNVLIAVQSKHQNNVN